MSAPAPGDELPARTVHVTRADLVRYAGASGDLNPIHWSERAATAAGLAGVIAHGMLTMGLAAEYLTSWRGDGAALRSFSVRFTRPVVVPDDEQGAAVEFGGAVSEVADDGAVTVTVTARHDGRAVLGKAVAVLAP